MTKAKKDTAQELANMFIEKLEQEQIPWCKPWECWTSWSRNSGNEYNGINQLILSGGEFVTFNQVRNEKNQDGTPNSVNKGAKHETVIYYNEYFAKYDESKNYSVEEIEKRIKYGLMKREDGTLLEKFKFVKRHQVFHVEDTTLKQKHTFEHNRTFEWFNDEKIDEIIKAFADSLGVEITEGGNNAFNAKAVIGDYNMVKLPRRNQFRTAAGYYKTAFHELIHSTSKALNRPQGFQFGSKAYAREELVAEIGAYYTMSYLGMEQGIEENTTAYIQNWAQVLKDDKNAILWATPKAIEAAEMIINTINQQGRSKSHDEVRI